MTSLVTYKIIPEMKKKPVFDPMWMRDIINYEGLKEHQLTARSQFH